MRTCEYDRTTDESASLDVLRTLAVKVRFLTSSQVAKHWLGGGAGAQDSAERMLDALEARQFISRTTIEVRNAGRTVKPLLYWLPGDLEPNNDDWDRLAATLEARWRKRLLPLEVFCAAPRAANLFGACQFGPGRPCEWSHDYRLTEVFLRYRKVSPIAIARWQGEAARPKWGRRIARMKDPDAMLMDGEHTIDKVIEVAGRYSPQHLAELHDHCAGAAFERFESWREQRQAADIPNPYQRIQIGYELW